MGVEIDSLPAAISLDGSEIVPIVQGGTTKRTTTGAIAAQTDPDLDSISSTQGVILYRGASDWEALSPGTSGYVLQTGGAAANPSWAQAGTVFSVALSGGTTGLSVSGSPITTSGTITLAGTLVAANGGTGITSYAVGDILYASASTTLSKLADVATGNALISGGVTTAPSWGKIGLTTHVDGTLPVANGGTALTAGTSGGVLAYTGTGVLASSAALAANQIVLGGGAGVVPATLGSLGTTTTVLHGNAAGAPTFGAVSLTADVSGTLPVANGGVGIASYTIGDILYASGATTLAALADIATGNALISGGVGAAPSWGKIALTTHVSGTLPVANGGTGLTAGTSGGVLAYTATGTLASSAALAANQIVLGGGAGVVPATLGSLGTTTTVLHGNAAGAPTFGAVSLTADITGTLAVANGGTGATTLTNHGVLLGQATSAVVATSAGTSGHVLTSGGASADPSFASISTALDVLGSTQGQVLYRNASAWVVLGVGSAGQVLQSGGAGANVSWQTVAGTGDVTAASAFGTDNVLVRSDGTGKGVQSTGIIVADTTNDISGTGFISPGSNDGGALGSGTLSYSDLFLASGAVINFNNGDVTVTHSANTLAFAGASSGYTFDSLATITSAGANALAVGANGTTNPVFNVNAATASVATGISITGAAAAGRVALAATSSGTDEGLSIDAKGAGTIRLGATSTGAIEFSRNAVPTSSDGTALGTTSLQWSDLFLADGGIINWSNGAMTITGAAGATDQMYFQGAANGYFFSNAVGPYTNDGAALGVASTNMWSDLFLASGGVINWNNGDVTVTHSANTLAFAGASSGYTFDAAVSVSGAAVKTVGLETIWIPAGSMVAKATNGAGTSTYDSGTNDVSIYTVDFDTTTQEYAHTLPIGMPKSWNESTVTAVFYWTNTGGASTETVRWSIAGAAISDDDTLNTTFGTAQTVDDTWLAQNDLHISAATSAVTIGGTPAENDMVIFEITRVVASDNMAGDARLLGVKILFTTNASTDA